MGNELVGIVVITAWVSLFSIIAFLILRKLHMLRVDPAIEEIGLDVAELGTVPEEYIEAVREQIKVKGSTKAAIPVHFIDEKEEESESLQQKEKEDEYQQKDLEGVAYIF